MSDTRELNECPVCNGRGRYRSPMWPYADERCYRCGGDGFIPAEDEPEEKEAR